MAVEEILEKVRAFGCTLVEVTGGEPLLQKGAVPLMRKLVDQGFEVMLETGGSLPIDDVPVGVRRIVDVKCPESGESDRNLWTNLEQLRDGDELKFVLAGREDYLWAREQIASRGLAARAPIVISPVHDTLNPGEMARWVLEDGLPVRVQIQLHKALWPGVLRGV
jgi:7-carboxy-7-deazaguanine synthase